MFEKFTDRARKVISLADDEAYRLNHKHLGTEHVLLGLIAEGSGIAAFVLKSMGVDLVKARDQVERLVKRKTESVADGKLAETPAFKKLVENSIEEARKLNHHYPGTEHLLLGLLCDKDNKASNAILGLGLNLEEVRHEVLGVLDHAP